MYNLKKAMKSLSEILGGNDSSSTDKKDTSPKVSVRKKEKKKQVAKSQDHGKLIEINRPTNQDFVSNSDESLLGEEVVLLDMDLSEPSKFLEENKQQDNKKNNLDHQDQLHLVIDLKDLKEGRERKESKELKRQLILQK